MPEQTTVIERSAIARRVAELGAAISLDYAGRRLAMVGVLNGAFIFVADLVRHITIPLTVDFIRVASYGDATVSSGNLRLTKDVELPLAGSDVLLIEDIVDSGRTLEKLLAHLQEKNPASIATCALIDKHERRERDVRLDYAGFVIRKGFLVGYGLDCAEENRHLPDICEIIG